MLRCCTAAAAAAAQSEEEELLSEQIELQDLLLSANLARSHRFSLACGGTLVVAVGLSKPVQAGYLAAWKVSDAGEPGAQAACCGQPCPAALHAGQRRGGRCCCCPAAHSRRDLSRRVERILSLLA